MDLKSNSGLTSEMLNVYEQLPGMCLILSADLLMITASDVYLDVTGKTKHEIEGKYIFDIFPNDPVSGIAESLAKVKVTHKAHHIPVIRFFYRY